MEDQTTETNDCTQGTEQQEATHEEHPHGEHHHGKHKHHQHRHHKRHQSKKKNAFLRFWKKNRSSIINILSCTVSVILLLLLALNLDAQKKEDIEGHYIDLTRSTVRIETSIYSQKLPLVNEAILRYMDPDNTQSANAVYKAYNGYQCPLNEGEAVSFLYQVTGLPIGVDVQSAVLELSEYEDYRNPQIYHLNLADSALELDMLKTGTKYYYRVRLTLDNANTIGTTGSFETEASPRILSIDGIVNVRDLGGWQVSDGRTVKQGLLYRGSELDGAVRPEYTLTELGYQQMTQGLGIRFDMDLRFPSENQKKTDALGDAVTHKYYGVSMYAAILDDKEQLRQLFSDLAVPENYPVYVHCTYGRDRTGTVCYLLEALLGVSDSDLEKDYSLSAFTDSYVNSQEFNILAERVNLLSGNTTQEKVEGYLLSIGVTQEQINSIREILLTPDTNS